MIKRTIFLIPLITLIVLFGICAEPTVLEIETEFVSDYYPFGRAIYYRNGKIFSGALTPESRVYNIDKAEKYEFDPENEIMRVLGEEEDLLIVNRGDGMNGRQPKEIFFYDTENNRYWDFPYIDTIESRVVNINHYIGSKYFVTKSDGEGYITKLIDFSDSTEMQIGMFVCDVTDDKQNFLLASSTIGIYNLNINKGGTIYNSRQLNGNYEDYEIPAIHFINNEYMTFRRSSQHSVYSIYSIDGNEVLRIQYVFPDDRSRERYRRIRDSEYSFFYPNVLVRTIGEREALEDFGILFRQTTGTVNDDRIRVRDLPLTDYGQHLGFLNTGDELEILDRGGLKIQIGDMNDYWYKVRRTSDGLEGWAYGYFIDVDVDEPLERLDDGSPRPYRILDRDPSVPIK